MKHIKIYINEKLHVTTKSHLHRYTCKPTTKKELKEIIIQRIMDDGLDCDLNDIDVSKINDMSWLFNSVQKYNGHKIFKNFNGDISLWDVSNVEDMHLMFNNCKKFNCNISRWDVSKVKYMDGMFNGCEQFNQNLDSWNVSNVNDMTSMFRYCKNFKQNLDNWNVSNVNDMWTAFYDCPTQPKWYDKNKWETE